MSSLALGLSFANFRTKLKQHIPLPLQQFLSTKVLPQQKFVTFFSIAFAIFNTASLSYLVYQNWALLLAYHWHLDLGALLLSFAAYSINLLVMVIGWHQLAQHFKIQGGLFLHFRIYVLSELSKRLPGKFWYIAGRVMMYQKQGASSTKVVVASGIETVLILNGALLGYFLSSAWATSLGAIASQTLGLKLGLVTGLSLVLIHPRIINWLLRYFKQSEVMEPIAYLRLLKWLCIYTAGWFCNGIMIFYWLRALEPLSFQSLPGIISTMSLIGIISNLLWLLPFTLGMRELALALLLKQFVTTPTALIASVVLRLLLWGYQLFYLGIVNLINIKTNHIKQTTPN